MTTLAKPSRTHKIFSGIGSGLKLVLTAFVRILGQFFGAALAYLANRREFAIWPMVFGLVVVLLAGAVFLATGRAVIASLDPLFDQILNLVVIVAVVALVGAMKTGGYLLSDITDENDAKTPWQKVVGSDLCTALLIFGLSWLLLSR